MEKAPLPIEDQIEYFDHKINKNEAMSKRLAIVGISGLCISGGVKLIELFSNDPSDDKLGIITIAGILGIASLLASYNLNLDSTKLKLLRDFAVFKKDMKKLDARLDTLESNFSIIQYKLDKLWYGNIIEGEFIRLPDNLSQIPITTQSIYQETEEYLLLTETTEKGTPTS